jgi:hypothetical protein
MARGSAQILTKDDQSVLPRDFGQLLHTNQGPSVPSTHQSDPKNRHGGRGQNVIDSLVTTPPAIDGKPESRWLSWGARKVTAEKPIVKPDQHHGTSGRGGHPLLRESSEQEVTQVKQA